MVEETCQYFILGSESNKNMDPEGTDDKIPTGWTLETEVQKDGSTKELYSCPTTGQQFYSHADVTRYVKYAKENKLGMYSLSTKSVKRERHVQNNSTATKRRKTSVATLSLRKKRSSSSTNSLTAEQRTDSNSKSKSSSSSESTNAEKDADYVPELDGDVAAEPDVNDADCPLFAYPDNSTRR